MFKGWKTRILNVLASAVGLATEVMPLLSQLTLEPELRGQIHSALLITVLVGNLILRELTDTAAGSAT